MKFFTNKGIVQKTVIALLIVILTTFAVPTTTVQADAGGKLMNPILNFIVAVFDGVQHLLEMAMLGETAPFMKDIDNSNNDTPYSTSGGTTTITTDEFIDATFFGINAVNIPVIQYTPEEIFSNRVPALDINFISPSITTGNSVTDEKMNVALKLQGVISSWYLALRSIAIVGLLSVLIYLGIRMLLTSVAADRAKYKQMLMDWLIGMCLVFTLHYIMSFTLTMAETVTAMLASGSDGTFTVHATNVDGVFWTSKTVDFSSNLMSYVRFMVQAGDLNVKIAFFALYIMLVIFNIRFTWIYLKRVVNMAFLTLLAPMVALMYPIDKVSDGKAQAFNMWLKEYIYNALIQPVDLLLYKVLLGSAITLAVDNPLYAIVALGFIIAAEKLVKQMFGFGKASGGTVGSLAGAAGVTALASQALNAIGKKGQAGGGKGKIRTKEIGDRQGKDADGNKPFKAFENKNANQVLGAGGDSEVPPPPSRKGEEQLPSKELSPEDQEKWNKYGEEKNRNDEIDQLEQELSRYDESDPYFMDPEHQEMQRKYQELREQEEAKQAGKEDDVPTPEEDDIPTPDIRQLGYDNPFVRSGREEDTDLFATMGSDYRNLKERGKEKLGAAKDKLAYLRTGDGKRDLKYAMSKKAIGAWKALPTVGYKAARGTLRTASRVALAGAMGGMGLVLGATTGDGDKAVSMALGAGSIGLATGDNLFDATVGQVMRDKSIRDAYDAGKYGNKIDARNARADKEYFRSEKFDDFYEKYYKGKKDMNGNAYTKEKLKTITQSYRKAGITSEGDIRRAVKLEEKYRQRDGLSEKDAREQVQNIVQSYKDMDMDKKAFSDEKARAKEISRIAGMLGGQTENNRKMASQIFQGYEDWRDSAV